MINIKPVILQHPRTVILTAPGNARFSVTAKGMLLKYQWQVCFVDDDADVWRNCTAEKGISGFQGQTLHVNGITADDIGDKYRCFVSNFASHCFSHAAAIVYGPDA